MTPKRTVRLPSREMLCSFKKGRGGMIMCYTEKGQKEIEDTRPLPRTAPLQFSLALSGVE